jgi:hypothetical protein
VLIVQIVLVRAALHLAMVKPCPLPFWHVSEPGSQFLAA